MANSESRAGHKITLILVHTNEGDNKPGDVGNDHTAENLAAYMERECAAGRGISYHRIVDDDSTVIMVPDNQAAWSARSANRRSLNICLTGWARWARAEWLQHPTMLERAGREIRAWAHEHDIPLIKLTGRQIATGARGVAGHVDWSESGLDDSDHTDPGRHFPWDVLLDSSTPKEAPMPSSVDLPATPRLDGGRPGPTWVATERTIAVWSPVRVVFGAGGAWIQEAWWRMRDRPTVHIVAPSAPRYLEQFDEQDWAAPSGARFLVIRYAAPSGGSVGLLL